MVLESLRERIDAHPFLRTLRQIPKNISSIIVAIAIKTIGLTGANTDTIETRRRDLVFILIEDMIREKESVSSRKQFLVQVFAFED
jgi:hypothetical protein